MCRMPHPTSGRGQGYAEVARGDALAAVRDRAAALAGGDAGSLLALLHPDFRWTSHAGQQFDRATYVAANTGGGTRWRRQDLGEPEVIVVDGTAVVRTTVSDTVDTTDGPVTHRMPMTQVWVNVDRSWLCLAGHAGPRLSE